MKSKRKPRKGDIWECWDVTNPARCLLLKKADAGNDWWEVLELDNGEFYETRVEGRDWKFIA